jgi:hypothetical protein
MNCKLLCLVVLERRLVGEKILWCGVVWCCCWSGVDSWVFLYTCVTDTNNLGWLCTPVSQTQTILGGFVHLCHRHEQSWVALYTCVTDTNNLGWHCTPVSQTRTILGGFVHLCHRHEQSWVALYTCVTDTNNLG